MKIISFYSYKGGVGRTMLTAQIARCLAALGKSVVVADFDFEAPGVPASFDKSIEDVEGGIFELFNIYKNDIKIFGKNLIKSEKFNNRFIECLKEHFKEKKYLLDIKTGLKGSNNTGKIRILPSGRLSNIYWNKIVNPEWLNSLKLDKKRRNSFSYFISNILIPTLAKEIDEKETDYLLVDSRTGITYYGSIAREIANRHVMIFCPNKEAKEALHFFLLPALKNFLKDDHLLDKVVFVVSRMPPELYKQGKEVFEEYCHLIENECTHDDKYILKFHSDLHTHLDESIRYIDERYINLFDNEGFKNLGKEDIDIVQIHEDILKILVALCPPDELN